jgi:hypothetical protein
LGGRGGVGVSRTDDAGRNFRVLHSIPRGLRRNVECSSYGTVYVVPVGDKQQMLQVDPRTVPSST